jgi:hypothetical protein
VKEFKASTKSAIKVILDDKEYVVRVPAIKDQLKMKELSKDVDPDSEAASFVLLDWLETLGLPKEASILMSQADLSSLVEDHLMPKKK